MSSAKENALRQPLIAIVGPTGVGKSRLAISLARNFNGEIINADSRQVYKYLDIGTTKPSPQEMASAPHHLYNIVSPDEDYSLARYQEQAYQSIKDIHSRRKLPLLVGGSGQYMWAVLEGWDIPRIPPDPEYRKKLESLAAENGIEELYQQLQIIDPEAAQKIDKRNIRRVIRALEVSHHARTSFSSLRRKKSPGYQTIIIGLTTGRAELYRRIDDRVDSMIKEGLIEEMEKLRKMSYDFNLPSLNTIGYKQIGLMLQGLLTREDAIKQIKTDTHRFVRHQYAWFSLKDSRIHWFDTGNKIEPEVMTLIANKLDIIEK